MILRTLLLAGVLLLRASVPEGADLAAITRALMAVARVAGCDPADVAATILTQDSGRTMIVLRCEIRD